MEDSVLYIWKEILDHYFIKHECIFVCVSNWQVNPSYQKTQRSNPKLWEERGVYIEAK